MRVFPLRVTHSVAGACKVTSQQEYGYVDQSIGINQFVSYHSTTTVVPQQNRPTNPNGSVATGAPSFAWSLDVPARRRGRCGQTEVKNELRSRSRGTEAVTQPVSEAQLHLMSSSGCHTCPAWNVFSTPRIENITNEHISVSRFLSL